MSVVLYSDQNWNQNHMFQSIGRYSTNTNSAKYTQSWGKVIYQDCTSRKQVVHKEKLEKLYVGSVHHNNKVV
jgi:hypothetical protein